MLALRKNKYERNPVRVRLERRIAFWNNSDIIGSRLRTGADCEEWLWRNIEPVTTKFWVRGQNVPEQGNAFCRWIPGSGFTDVPFDGSTRGRNFDIKVVYARNAPTMGDEITVYCTDMQRDQCDIYYVIWILEQRHLNAPNTKTVRLIKCIKV